MTEGIVILHDAAKGQWLRFNNPFQIVVANRLEEVVPSLERIESLVKDHGWYAAGYLSYEASSAFDEALCTMAAGDFPLLWFGLYPAPEEIQLPKPNFQAYSLAEPIPSLEQKDYNRAIERIKDYIKSGDTYQVNFTIRLRSRFTGDPWHLFLGMVRAQSDGYAAWIDIGRYAICSASPELFFRLDGDVLACKPMKGTVRRGRRLEEDNLLADWLHSSEKNRAENLMIVDMIRNDLGRVADVGSVSVPGMFEVERHPTLWQMTSTITAGCRKSLVEIMSALFPCASITGAPKVRTTQIIAELENTPRGLYTGSIGYITPNRSAQFSVAIRTAVIDRPAEKAEYGSGGGIVWDSACKDEYTEALLKARVLTEQRPEFSLLETMRWTPEESYFLLHSHLQRLSNSAAYFGFSVDIEQIGNELAGQVVHYSGEEKRVRLIVATDGNFEIQAFPLEKEESDQPKRIMLAKGPVNSADVFLYHKTTHRRLYEEAKNDCPGSEDVLLWNERGELTESCIANLIVEIDRELFTPPVDCGLLPGTFRAWLLEQGIIKEKILKVEDLNRCSKICLINSVRKWQAAELISKPPA
jgi:para-aminobenzoate synthetase / 4-amino-4-deoxychorismate lyase